jgi:hypothetical protein
MLTGAPSLEDMPVYRCPSCGEHDLSRDWTDPVVQPCVFCGKLSVRQGETLDQPVLAEYGSIE